MRILKRAVLPFAFMSLLLSACGGNTSQLSEGSGSADQSSHIAAGNDNIVNDPAYKQEISDFDSDIVETSDGLTFPIGNTVNIPGAFTGTVYLASMIAEDEIYHFPQTKHVRFEPGARSNWHSHGGMVILVTGGIGYYQEEGSTAQIIRKGDVIECAPGVRHWHGAAPDSWFSQMVVFDSGYSGAHDGETPVTDAYYEELEAEEYTGRNVTVDNGFMFQRSDQAVNMQTFSGLVYLSDIIGENVAGAPGMHYVVFEPGVINNWHTHEGGQILIATDGIGYHQMEGEPVEVLYPGDVAFCPPGIKHWHGGSADMEFAHIAINTNPGTGGVEWFGRISEKEYSELPVISK